MLAWKLPILTWMTIDHHQDDLFTLMRNEPEQLELLLKVGIGVPIAIVALHVAAQLVLPEIGIAPITWLLISAYGVAMAYLAGRLVLAATRWEVEAVRTAERMAAASPRVRGRVLTRPAAAAQTESRPEPARLKPQRRDLQAPASGSDFPLVYFLLRLHQDLLRARREGLQLSIVALAIGAPGSTAPEVTEKIAIEVANFAAKQTRSIALPAQVSDNEFVFSLPEHDGAAARALASQLVRSFGEYWCHFGIAVYPDDAHDADSLVEHARSLVEESQQAGGKPSRRRTLRSR